MTVVSIGCDLMMPWASSHLIDTLAKPDETATTWPAWALFVAAFAGYAFARNLAHRAWIQVAAYNMETITNEGYARVQAFPAQWHASNASGGTIRRLGRAMWGYDAVTDAATIWLGPAVVVLFGLSVMLFLRQWVAGCISFVIALLFIACNSAIMDRYLRPANQRSNKLDADVNVAVADAVSANITIKLFGAEERELQKLKTVTAAWRDASATTWRRFVNVGFAQNCLLLILQAGLSGTMINAWRTGQASAGDVAFAITSFMVMSASLRNLGDNVRTLQKGMDDVSDVVGYHVTPVEDMRQSLPDLAVNSGVIEFDDICFSYGPDQRNILNGASFRICSGETVAIVGASGAGKSTVVKLLSGLYEPARGRITIDGLNIACVNKASLRRAVSVAMQEPDLLNRSIFDNICLARPDAGFEEVMTAARIAQVSDFADKLADKFETIVGEKGANLSGGERQRISLARAFLAEAAILVLDEATSALDGPTEDKLLANLRSTQSQRTTIIIAHRQSSIRHAHRVLSLEDGQLREITNADT